MNTLRADHISPLDMFKIGIGPSSSHTVGPMVAALAFRQQVLDANIFGKAELKFQVELYGSLSATGRGHATDSAICAGLSGLNPRVSEPEKIWSIMPSLQETGVIDLAGNSIAFHPDQDIVWMSWLMDGNGLPHPNTIRFRLWQGKSVLIERIVLSVGGGFVEAINTNTEMRSNAANEDASAILPYPYNSAAEFVQQCINNQLPPWAIVIANESKRQIKEKELRQGLAAILATMEKAIEAGLSVEGILPGGLNVRRRAKSLYEQMLAGKTPAWAGSDLRPSVYAIAVNEENAAGGRVVTAPTNGSSGIIPAVWRYLREVQNLDEETLENGLITASVIGALVRVHASISGAEVGCQGEVGTSCAMAAAGATAMLGGSPYQIEQAAEIGIEHHLGMTCDPIMGLVQVPCIERNAMGAVKALNAAALSLSSDGIHLVSLDRALQVMKETGLDMNHKYKETATGGLALG